MARKKKPKRNAIDRLGDTTVGVTGLGVGLGVGGSILARGSALGGPNLGGSLTTIAGFAPIAVTGSAARITLDTLKDKKKKRRFF